MKKVTPFIMMLAFWALSFTSVAHTATFNDLEENLQKAGAGQVINVTYDPLAKVIAILVDVPRGEKANIKVLNIRGYTHIHEVVFLRGGVQKVEIPVKFMRSGEFKLNIFSKSLKYSSLIKIY